MNDEEFKDMIGRLKASRLSRKFRSELIGVLRLQRHVLQEAWVGSRARSHRSVEILTGIVLGKNGYKPGDVGF